MMLQGRDHLQVDQWPWGNETIIWGYDPTHQYTFKLLEPKKGRDGCLSLQYHHVKSESWLVRRGMVWGLLIIDGQVCTRIMRPGDIQNIHPGMIHRVTGVTDDAQIIEPSTPDKHAADKTVKKDVVRLHCVHGRPCDPAPAGSEALVKRAIEVTEEALVAIAAGKLPIEHNPGFLVGRGSFALPS